MENFEQKPIVQFKGAHSPPYIPDLLIPTALPMMYFVETFWCHPNSLVQKAAGF